ncbi:E3 ubiquitin protein ligase DRIP2-like [Vicia villosa]|uniref:E3 ubiquitin protein ligase DRIP2-like n=1 Tax=Vicia villosa TaxID=3911 RepID=UPI00273B0040|nr:E3 ubiquitin protein ligase DRIP2-like [Vicia villosa]XP_058737973.1 E3 ubiquitin protein ligase DRIP2-like [Vicia villosa]
MTNQVVRVKRATIAACMTCPLCNKLFKQATTISECLHTFCRKCIYDKITDEDLECCPECNIDLGCVPLEKLRPDHTKQDVRAKIFPLKGRKVKEPEVVAASVPLPAKRKERSLSSLVVNTPRVSAQSTMTGRRTKPTRKASSLQSSSFSFEKPIKKEEALLDDRLGSSSSPETSNKLRQSNGQSEGSQSTPNKETENGAETYDAKLDLWKPLNCLVEVASRTKSFKSNTQGSTAKLEPIQVNESESQVQKIKNKENKRKAKAEGEKISPFPVSSDTAKPNKLRRVRRKKETFGESGISPQAVVDSTSNKLFMSGPIWFSLVASENQEGDAPLPQIPASYLRIKDGSVPVSFIQKYLMKKLDLTSETEIEIKCMGQPVLPTLKLHSLVELWLDSTASASDRIPAIIGSSAKDFVMVLAYARKTPHP